MAQITRMLKVSGSGFRLEYSFGDVKYCAMVPYEGYRNHGFRV